MDAHKLLTKRYLPVVIIVAAIIIFALLLLIRPSNKITASKERVWSVDVATVKLTNISPTIQLYGKVETPRQTMLEASLNAYVKSTPVLEGHAVKKGQTTIVLDDRDTQIALRQYVAEAANLQAKIKAEINRYKFDQSALKHEEIIYNNNKNQLERMRTLIAKKIIARVTFEQEQNKLRLQEVIINKRKMEITDHHNRMAQLQAQLAKAKAQVDQAKLDIERTNIKAPFAGRIAKLYVSVGDRVKISDPLAQIFDTHNLEVRAPIPNQYQNNIQQALTKKNKVKATTSYSNKLFTLYLDRLSSTITVGRAAIDGLFRFSNKNSNIPLGLSLKLQVQLPPIKNVFGIPNQALYENNIIYKYVDQRMVAAKINVVGTTTKNSQEYVLIKCKTLKDGDQIITTAIPGAITGLRVQPVTTTS